MNKQTNNLNQPEAPSVYLPAVGTWPQAWYLLDDRSKDAIKLAEASGRPLLIRGLPGTGKSDLARAAAEYLGRAFIYEVVTARTEPQDLLWRFDAIARLSDAQAHRQGDNISVDPRNYVSPGVMWWAINWGSAEKKITDKNCKTFAQRPDKELQSLRDRSRVLPRSDSACVFTERCLRSENAGFPTSRRVICVPKFQPLVGLKRGERGRLGQPQALAVA